MDSMNSINSVLCESHVLKINLSQMYRTEYILNISKQISREISEAGVPARHAE